jgi:hypothetical protein
LRFKYQANNININIPAGSLGIRLGQYEKLPIAACHVPQQLYKPRLPPDGVSAMLNFVPSNPQARFQMINSSWHKLGHHLSPFLAEAGIEISATPIQVDTKVLTYPNIEFKNRDLLKLTNAVRMALFL